MKEKYEEMLNQDFEFEIDMFYHPEIVGENQNSLEIPTEISFDLNLYPPSNHQDL